MKTTFIFLMMLISVNFMCNADEPEWDNANVPISMSGNTPPRFADVDPPVAMYNTVTQEIIVTFNVGHYSDYTITLVSGLIEVDYYPFSSVVCMPTASMGDVVTIYIESDDCGSWFGEIDKTYFGGPISN